MKKLFLIAMISIAGVASAQDKPIVAPNEEVLDVMSAEEIESRIQGRKVIEEAQGIETAPALEFTPPTGDSVADLIARLGYMEEEMRRLNGRVSQLQFELKNAAKQAASAPALADKSEQYVAHTGDVNDKYVIKVEGADLKIAEDEATQDPAATEEADFNAGVAQISEQNLNAAKKKFSEFIAAYPESTKVADAYFWLGEISMDEAQYKDGALNYLRSYKADKQGKRAEEALLKSSIALGKLGKKEEACKNLTTLKNMEGLQDLLKEQASSEAIKLGCK